MSTIKRLAHEEALIAAEISRGGPRTLDVDQMLLAVGEAVGRFAMELAIAAKAVHILDIGTSFGYSTLFLASAARTSGGLLTSLELAPHKHEYAAAMMARAGLSDCVAFHTGDALASLDALQGPFDFVLLDIWKDLYIPCFERMHTKLDTDAIVLADNMLLPTIHRDDARRYQNYVRGVGNFQSVLLPIGSGIELSVKS